MTRLLALILLAILVYLLVSALLRRLSAAAGIGGGRGGKGAPGRHPAAGGAARGESLVRCATCGVRLPESRALPASARDRGGGAFFCSEDCRRQGGPGGGGPRRGGPGDAGPDPTGAAR